MTDLPVALHVGRIWGGEGQIIGQSPSIDVD